MINKYFTETSKRGYEWGIVHGDILIDSEGTASVWLTAEDIKAMAKKMRNVGDTNNYCDYTITYEEHIRQQCALLDEARKHKQI